MVLRLQAKSPTTRAISADVKRKGSLEISTTKTISMESNLVNTKAPHKIIVTAVVIANPGYRTSQTGQKVEVDNV